MLPVVIQEFKNCTFVSVVGVQQCRKSYESPTNNLRVIREHWFATRITNMAGRGLVSREKAGFSECPLALLTVNILASFTLLHLNLTTLPTPNESGQVIEIGIYF